MQAQSCKLGTVQRHCYDPHIPHLHYPEAEVRSSHQGSGSVRCVYQPPAAVRAQSCRLAAIQGHRNSMTRTCGPRAD